MTKKRMINGSTLICSLSSVSECQFAKLVCPRVDFKLNLKQDTSFFMDVGDFNAVQNGRIEQETL